MKLIIDISDEYYRNVCKRAEYFGKRSIALASHEKAIANGTPLPKGHGKLVDISKIDEDRIESDNPIIYLTINGEYTEAISLDYLNNLPTIIEADKESTKPK